MWLSKQWKSTPEETTADLGTVTIGGENVAALARGEVRDLPIFSPGGYGWLPKNGDTVLVIRGGTGGEERCATAVQQAALPRGMAAGEVFLFSGGGATLYLKNDGSVELTGTLRVHGTTYTDALFVDGKAVPAPASAV